MRSGYGRSLFEPLLPLILGRDVSGEVAAVGASVRTLSVGQEVFGALHPTAVRGTYADYAILSEDELSVKPVSISHVEASAIPFAALTAWRALKSTARITEGQRLLVVGGGGAVGFSAIQLSVAAGCHVSTTCGSESIDRVLAAGAEQAVDYTTEDVEFAIKGQFDAVLDTIGVPETERIGINLLKRGGHYMTLQGEAASLTDRYGIAIGLPTATAILLKKQIQYRYSHGIEYWWTYMRADAEGLDEIRKLSEAGKLKIPVEKTFPITQVREAHEAKDKRRIPERPHRPGSTSSSSEHFICFTSPFSSSSSSMKLSSKSILSPGRTRDPPVSLSNSLSRRLRTNGSMKGGQASPMFPTCSRKRGCAFENPEPSSPKVTCIGQVRVKTKKQGQKMRTLSKQRGGEVSFRKVEQTRDGIIQTTASSQNQQQQQPHECLPHRNQRWVHFPLTICEALRGFGAEFSCLFPCRPSCFSTSEREKKEKAAGSNGGESADQSSCGAVFARWLVALQDGDGGKGRTIEFVVGGEEERTELAERSLRRHAMEEVEIRDEKCEVLKDEETVEEEARVSICIPPKNALLLMRCRSDPMRMAALANRFLESPAPKDEDDAHEEEQVNLEPETKHELRMEDKEDEVCEKRVSNEACEEQESRKAEETLVIEIQEAEEQEVEENPEEILETDEEFKEEIQEKQEHEVRQTEVEGGNVLDSSSSKALVDQETVKNEEQEPNLIHEEEKEERIVVSVVSVLEVDEPEAETIAEATALKAIAEKSTVEKGTRERLEEEEEKVTQERLEADEDTQENHEGEEHTAESEERESHVEEKRESPVKKQERESSVLPDCLLLMMCEPKLSMEVSRETWVCSTDFIRWQPEKQVNLNNGGDEQKTRVSRLSTTAFAAQPPVQQPPRSSCCLPAPAAAVACVSMAKMIEQKLVNAVAYEPLVLTRCKSEPMRRAVKLAPESCVWKNRKLEPHRRATLGVGAAGVGF
ncbi:hypothetical protein F0562_010369 [Nyssa sinensis]|uniref:Enoyl reductase (ER) domain-containing protein n=1 Tax=Nyssa sinensis TaxID=561372 RepID=A0A5J5A1L3_9ASTE|nr:hypothetical protein F0562_010369 [Nyssa sinensis]